MVASRIAALLLLASCAACASPGQQQVAYDNVPSTVTVRNNAGQSVTLTGGQALLAVAVVELARRNIPGAVAAATRAIESGQLAGPHLAAGYSFRGYALFAMNDAARARDDWRRAVEINPDDQAGLRGLALIAHMQRRPAEVAQYMGRAIAAAPNDADNYIMRGMIALADRRVTPAALADFEKAIALRPGSASAHYHRGLYYHMAGRLVQARQDYTKALDVNPGETRARAGLEMLDRQARIPLRPAVPATPKILDL